MTTAKRAICLCYWRWWAFDLGRDGGWHSGHDDRSHYYGVQSPKTRAASGFLSSKQSKLPIYRIGCDYPGIGGAVDRSKPSFRRVWCPTNDDNMRL